MKLPIPFNNPDTYPGHSGVDFGQSRGVVFRASGPGVVTVRGHSARAGYTIWVRYDAGCEVGYVHMDSHAGCPAVGTRVVEGTQLGLVGNSGNSTGPHLHVEVENYATTAGFWQWFTPDRVVGHQAPSKDPKPKPPSIPPLEEDMTIIVQRTNPALAKGRLIGGGKIQEITRAENNAYRAAEKINPNAVIYVTVTDADYKALKAGK